MTAMEWVETTGRTLDEAKEAALDRLGIDEHDAEFEVLAEPRTGLFGRLRGEARVRARVRPLTPRPKTDRRDRRKGGDRARRGPRGARGRAKRSSTAPATGARGQDAPRGEAEPPAGPQPAEASVPAAGPDAAAPAGTRASTRRARRARPTPPTTDPDRSDHPMTETELAAQGEVVKDFLVELLDAFEADGTVSVSVPDDEHVDIAVDGDDLGLLIGPKGQTLQAIQELSRSVLQRTLPGQTHGRLRVDVAGYRQRRREALERFTRQVAEQVLSSGTEAALEPMSPPDRKVVHDTVNEIDGVTTTSEGEEPRRRVVIAPESVS
jgi:spoIIIJ-associated protein